MKTIFLCCLLAILSLTASCSAGSKRALTLDECSQIIAGINKTVPKLVNRFTTLDGVACGAATNSVYILYLYTTDMNTFKVHRATTNIEANRWCTDPEQKLVLEMVSYVVKKYYDHSGKFLGTFTFSRDDCATP